MQFVSKVLMADNINRRLPGPEQWQISSHHDLPIAPNRLDQKFAAERPNQVWLADITYVPTGEGWLYLAVVLDLFTRKIVGWAGYGQTNEACGCGSARSM
jgi:transposase InsO family protein